MSRRNLLTTETYQLYNDMRPVWSALWAATQGDFKQRLAAFLKCTAKIQAVRSDYHHTIRRLAWLWFHSESEYGPCLGFHVITDANGLSTLTYNTNRYIEAYLKINYGSIDEISSEQEWRRGLHTERSQVKLYK